MTGGAGMHNCDVRGVREKRKGKPVRRWGRSTASGNVLSLGALSAGQPQPKSHTRKYLHKTLTWPPQLAQWSWDCCFWRFCDRLGSRGIACCMACCKACRFAFFFARRVSRFACRLACRFVCRSVSSSASTCVHGCGEGAAFG